MSSPNAVRRYTRTRSRRVLDVDANAFGVDLNALPQHETRDQEGPSNHTRSQLLLMPPTIDVDALDDDVIISSPRAFAEAKNNNRSRERKIVVDLESDERSARHKGRRVPPNQTVINLDGSSTSKRKSICGPIVPFLPPPPPKEPTFSCPICMGTLVEETSTKCGHIFCKKCIKAAIGIRAKCPTCNRKTTARDIFRIYLPASRID